MKYVLLFLCLIVSGVDAQPLQVATGSKINDFDADSFKFYSLDSVNLYAIWNKNGIYYLDIYSRSTLNRVAMIKIPLPSGSEAPGYNMDRLIMHNDSFLVFYSYFDKSASCEKLEMVSFNKEGSLLGEKKLIDVSEGKNEKKAGSFSIINRRFFNEFLSYGVKHRKDTTYINIDHFDYSGNKTRSQSIVKTDDDYVEYSFLDNDCNLYHLTRNKSGNRNVKWNIRIYSPDNSKSVVIPLKRPDEYDVYLSNFFRSYVDQEHFLNLMSPYTLGPNAKNAEGLYIVKIDPETHALISENVIPFKVRKQDDAEETEFVLSSCIIVGIIPLLGQGVRVVFESRLHTRTTMYGIPVDNDYAIGNIITVDIDNSGKVTEIHKIRKDQDASISSFKYTGFAILNYNDKSYFIYNELPDNLQRRSEYMKKVRAGKIEKTVVIYTTIKDHKAERKILVNKPLEGTVNAVLPYEHLADRDNGEVYLLRQIKDDIYLTKVFVREHN